MQHIIVGFLDIQTARKAAEEAARIAVQLGAALHIVTALEDPTVDVLDAGGERFVLDDFERAEAEIHRFMSELEQQPEYTVAVFKGKPADALIDEAERLKASMIVVGNVRMQGPGRILGSVGNKITHHAPCNVLIAKTT